MGIYRIADIFVKMEPKGDILLNNCKKYLSDSTRFDVEINVTQTHIQNNKKEHPNLTDAQLEYLIAGAFFYKYLLDFDGMMLHSSAVVVDGRAYLFSGNSGAGKSTHTTQWLELFGDKAYILNDDKPAIRIVNGKLFVYGTPFSGKYDISKNTCAELSGICFIEQDENNSIERMPLNQCIPLLMQQTFYSLPKKQMDTLLGLLDKMLNLMPVYKLKCNISTDAARLSYNIMSGAIENE